MTEAEWLTCTNPQEMLGLFGGPGQRTEAEFSLLSWSTVVVVLGLVLYVTAWWGTAPSLRPVDGPTATGQSSAVGHVPGRGVLSVDRLGAWDAVAASHQVRDAGQDGYGQNASKRDRY